MKYSTKALVVLATLGLILETGSCGTSASTATESGNAFTLGVTPGPYAELFKKGIEPILSKEGYSVTYKNLNDPETANEATEQGLVDLTVTQHRAYMEAFNTAKGGHLVDVTALPSLPTGVYSQRRTSIRDVKDGDLVLVPQDSSNLARSLVLLQDIGWIKLDPKVDAAKFTPNSITENPHQLDIKLVDRASVPRNLPDTDWGVICGQPAYNSKVDPKLELAKETFRPEYLVRAVVSESTKNAKWVSAVVKAYHSKEFKDFVNTDSNRDYWYLPGDDA